ncbi:MAG: NrfD/PsrC family molybdoenzyme membrane anchor subunit [Burkholderiales bacterium]
MRSIIQFAIDFATYVIKGGLKFYAWIAFLGVFVLILLYGTYLQATEGLIITGLTNQITDGLYIANFVFMVGVAAGAVTIMFPAHVYHHKGLHDVTVLGEMLAVSAVMACNLFILSHMGRPERLWHMIPPFGILNIPSSALALDVITLSTYLILNLVGGFYFMYTRYMGTEVNRKFYMPLIYISIVWALSIHTVTAFFLSTMPARPLWNTSMMPIRFIATAFAAGPSLIILLLLYIRKNTRLSIDDSAINTLSTIVAFCLGIALYLTMSEIVTELYAVTEHSLGLQYLMFGLDGLNRLVPWFWASLVFNLVAFVMLLTPSVRKNHRLLPIACILAFGGIWIEKGMGTVVPGFIPTPSGEVTEYAPTLIEILITMGDWAMGMLIATVLMKGAIGILLGEVKYASEPWSVIRNAAPLPYRTSFEPTRMQPWARSSDPDAKVDVGSGARRGSRARRQGRVAVG